MFSKYMFVHYQVTWPYIVMVSTIVYGISIVLISYHDTHTVTEKRNFFSFL